MTINRLADLTGIRQSTLSSVMVRGSVPKLDMLYKICLALDISLVEFLNIPPYKNDNENFDEVELGLSKDQLDKLKVFIKSLKE